MVEKRRRYENGVIISIYVESKIRRYGRETDRIKIINPAQISSQSRVSGTRGYDRRAQLLAYAQELKRADGEQLKRPLKNLRRKPKERGFSIVGERIRRFFSRFGREKRVWKYESIVKEERSDCEKKWSYGNGNGRRRRFHFCKKLKYLLKTISGAWKCKSGIVC